MYGMYGQNFQSMDQPGVVANPARGQLNKENIMFPCPRSRRRMWSLETGSAIPSRVSLLILHTPAESGVCSWDSSRFPRRRPNVPSTAIESVPSLSETTQWRTDNVHCQKSACTEPVVLKVVPVTGAALSSFTTDHFLCTSLSHGMARNCCCNCSSHSACLYVVANPKKLRYVTRSWSAEEGKENKKRKSRSAPPAPPRCSIRRGKKWTCLKNCWVRVVVSQPNGPHTPILLFQPRILSTCPLHTSNSGFG